MVCGRVRVVSGMWEDEGGEWMWEDEQYVGG